MSAIHTIGRELLWLGACACVLYTGYQLHKSKVQEAVQTALQEQSELYKKEIASLKLDIAKSKLADLKQQQLPAPTTTASSLPAEQLLIRPILKKRVQFPTLEPQVKKTEVLIIGGNTSGGPQYAKVLSENMKKNSQQTRFLLWDPKPLDKEVAKTKYADLDVEVITDLSGAIQKANMVFVAMTPAEFTRSEAKVKAEDIKAGQKWASFQKEQLATQLPFVNWV